MTRTALAAVLALTLSACGPSDAPDAPADAAETPSDAPEATPAATPAAARMESGVQVADITVGADGYRPASVALRAGVPARLVFTRTTDDTCGTSVKAPTLGVAPTPLPLNRPVAVEFTPDEAGRFAFACGMDMMEGTVVVSS